MNKDYGWERFLALWQKQTSDQLHVAVVELDALLLEPGLHPGFISTRRRHVHANQKRDYWYGGREHLCVIDVRHADKSEGAASIVFIRISLNSVDRTNAAYHAS
jgi:hypothetical protein